MRRCVILASLLVATGRCAFRPIFSSTFTGVEDILVEMLCKDPPATVLNAAVEKLMMLNSAKDCVKNCIEDHSLYLLFTRKTRIALQKDIMEILFLFIHGHLGPHDIETFLSGQAETCSLNYIFDPAQCLTLSHLDFVRFPVEAINSISKALKLRRLYIRNCTGVTIDDIERLDIPSLLELGVVGLGLREIPCLKRLPSLTVLDISNNCIDTFNVNRYHIPHGDADAQAVMPNISKIILDNNPSVDFCWMNWTKVFTGGVVKITLTTEAKMKLEHGKPIVLEGSFLADSRRVRVDMIGTRECSSEYTEGRDLGVEGESSEPNGPLPGPWEAALY